MSPDVLICDPVEELSSGEFGHGRRTSAVRKVARGLSERPGASFPQIFDRKDLECAYRVFGNDDINWAVLLDGHVRATTQRCSQQDLVLVVHDTTEIGFHCRGGHCRDGFSRLSPKRQGFYLHTTLAVASASGMPLGVVAAQPYVHQSQVPDVATRKTWEEMQGLYDNEQQRWIEAVNGADETLGEDVPVLHLMDSEGDAYETISPMIASQQRFVVRAQQDHRRTVDGNLAEFVKASPARSFRTLDIQIRHASKGKRPSKRNAARKRRKCEVAIRSCAIELKRPQKIDATLPRTLKLHAVDVQEVDPPNKDDVIHWTLFTTEPIETVEQVEAIVDYYCARWVIEEFFKALKTGCLAESRQLESIEAYLTFLALALPIAVKMLQLRTLARSDMLIADDVLTPTQQRLIAEQPRARLPQAPTAADYLYAVAALGGHLKNNGPPGWQTLFRGFEALSWIETGWETATARGTHAKSDQS